jgi:hypothetical protein
MGLWIKPSFSTILKTAGRVFTELVGSPYYVARKKRLSDFYY